MIWFMGSALRARAAGNPAGKELRPVLAASETLALRAYFPTAFEGLRETA
jgi:hypothetical protein